MKWPLAFLGALALNVIVFGGLDSAAVASRDRYAIAIDIQTRQINRSAKADRLPGAPAWSCEVRR